MALTMSAVSVMQLRPLRMITSEGAPMGMATTQRV